MTDSIEQEQQFLTLVLDQAQYAINILCIREILEHCPFTEVPMMPSCVRGVINLRGRVVPVIDLLARFNHGETTTGRRTCIVILEVEGDEGPQEVGVLVDAVNEVVDIPAANIEPAPAFGAHIPAPFIKGMGRVDGGFVVILDIGQVLSIEEMVRLAGRATTSLDVA